MINTMKQLQDIFVTASGAAEKFAQSVERNEQFTDIAKSIHALERFVQAIERVDRNPSFFTNYNSAFRNVEFVHMMVFLAAANGHATNAPAAPENLRRAVQQAYGKASAARDRYG